jgi:hypothetical protein
VQLTPESNKVLNLSAMRHGEEHQLKNRASILFGISTLGLSLMMVSRVALALELDWSGQFWSEFNYVHNYSMDSSDQGAGVDVARDGQGGYYIPGGGSRDANFQSLFLRLRPKVVVNDNIYIKSELWVGDPIFGIFGNAVPYTTDQRQYYSSQSRGSIITAQRFWGEFLSDIGTFQIGRVPLSWGLGIVWNAGDNLWDRYMSTGDAIRWIAKFGSFSVIPSFIVNSTGNTIGGACTVSAAGNCVPGTGSGGVSDYSLIFEYENPDDDLEVGINVLKRLGGAGQDTSSGIQVPSTTAAATVGSMNFITYDIFARKKLSQLTLGAEVPITSGTLGAAKYSTVAFGGEADWKASDSFEFLLKAGYAPGQDSLTTGAAIDTYKAFYFNPNYHIAMIMFNYQLANFSRAQTLNNSNLSPNQLGSPYDNPIVDAQYISLATHIKPWEKWTIRPTFAYAVAPKTASMGQSFYNYWTKTYQTNNSGKSQGSSLGFEFDLGLTFQWDEYFQFSWDNGFFFPGNYYAFSNTATDNATSTVFATSIRVGVNF